MRCHNQIGPKKNHDIKQFQDINRAIHDAAIQCYHFKMRILVDYNHYYNVSLLTQNKKFGSKGIIINFN